MRQTTSANTSRRTAPSSKRPTVGRKSRSPCGRRKTRDVPRPRITSRQLKRYRNLSGSSGVIEYAYQLTWIVVSFRGNLDLFYIYTDEKPGAPEIAEMKSRADAGIDLSRYISQEVQSNFVCTISRSDLLGKR